MNTPMPADVVITPDQMLQHWQGHRALTRRMIEAFPENDLFNYTIGGMRPFAKLVTEFIGMAAPTLNGVATGKWEMFSEKEVTTKDELLKQWDTSTEEINRLWPTIALSRWKEVDKAFGQWEMPMHGLLLYVIDNEVHHRGQGYVYLRALGIEPPPFYERG